MPHLANDAFSRALKGVVLGCNAPDTHVYRHHSHCRNTALFFIPEIGMRFCKYHLGDVLHLLDLEQYTLHRLDW